METQATIVAWAEVTFGRAVSPQRIIVRAAEEAVELMRCLSVDDRHPHATEEIADTLIVLMGVAHVMDFDLLEQANGILADWRTGPDAARLSGQSNLHTAAAAVGCLALAIRNETLRLMNCALAAASLLDLAGRLEVDVQAEIDAKMAVNRARVWKLDGSGHGHHVRDKGVA